VCEIGFPTNYLSTKLNLPKKPIAWIAAAARDRAIVLEMVFTREREEKLRELAKQGQRSLVAYTQLSNGEAFAVTSRDAAFAGENFVMPASHYQTQDYVFSSDDPVHTGRPVRLAIFTNPRDGDRMAAWEYGGFHAKPGEFVNRPGFGTFSRTGVIERK
jgi:hypothetical protein